MASPDAMAVEEVGNTREDVMEIEDSRKSQQFKRKASLEPVDRDDVPKRSRYDSEEDDRHFSRGDSQPNGAGIEYTEEPLPERRPPVATQEDKKRGKRLFGGLLNTLNQGPSSSQQKRRQEIEKRLQERMQKQDAEDGQRRAERLAELRTVRIREQIIFDEEVMRNRHIKKLAMARYLQTKAEPKIYYLPWRCTDEERDIIEEQRREARALVQREEMEFEKRRKWHVERHGAAIRGRPPSPPREQPPSPAASPPPAVDMVVDEPPQHADVDIGVQKEAQEDTRHEVHDDAGDIVEHAGEDMVIY